MWRIMISPRLWLDEEDEILTAAVRKYNGRWNHIASLLHRKSAEECKARWCEWLNPGKLKLKWNGEEDEKLLLLAALMPSQWPAIALTLGRPAEQCLERYKNLDLLNQAQKKEEVDPNAEVKPALKAVGTTISQKNKYKNEHVDPLVIPFSKMHFNGELQQEKEEVDCRKDDQKLKLQKQPIADMIEEQERIIAKKRQILEVLEETKMELARELQVKRNQKSLPQPPNIIMYVLHISDLLRVDPSLTDLQEAEKWIKREIIKMHYNSLPSSMPFFIQNELTCAQDQHLNESFEKAVLAAAKKIIADETAIVKEEMALGDLNLNENRMYMTARKIIADGTSVVMPENMVWDFDPKWETYGKRAKLKDNRRYIIARKIIAEQTAVVDEEM